MQYGKCASALALLVAVGCGGGNNGTENNGTNNGASNGASNNGASNNGASNNGATDGNNGNNGSAAAFSCQATEDVGGVTVQRDFSLSVDGREARFYTAPNCSMVSGTTQVQPTFGWSDRLADDQSLSSGYLLLGFIDNMMEADPGTYTIIPQPTSNDEYQQTDKVYGLIALGEPDGSAPNTFYPAKIGTVTISESPGENDGEVCKQFSMSGATFEAENGGGSVTVDARFGCIVYR